MNIFPKVDAFEMNIVVSASPCSSIKSVLFVEHLSGKGLNCLIGWFCKTST